MSRCLFDFVSAKDWKDVKDAAARIFCILFFFSFIRANRERKGNDCFEIWRKIFFIWKVISQKRESCIHSWNNNNKFVKVKFKFIQIREIKIRLERFFEKLYLYWKFSRRKFGESSQFFFFSRCERWMKWNRRISIVPHFEEDSWTRSNYPKNSQSIFLHQLTISCENKLFLLSFHGRNFQITSPLRSWRHLEERSFVS